jgi:hypothetical protein
MNRYRITVILALTTITALWMVGAAFADTATTTRSDGYTVTLTGPTTATVGVPATFTATCGPTGQAGPCPYGEFRAFGGVINRLGEGFGRGAMGSYVFRAPGYYSVRYRVGASCPGSPRLACPIDAWLSVSVTA